MPYQPIENYGVIGDMHSLALVGINGSIDWLCYPHFDSPSVFGALLDHQKGGSFQIAPVDDCMTRRQLYWPDTNVLVTRFLHPDGVGEVVDFMPVTGEDALKGYHKVVRRVSAARGCLEFRITCHPAFNYARDTHDTRLTEHGAVFASSALSLALASPVPLTVDERGVTATFTLKEGESATFILHEAVEGEGPSSYEEATLEQLFTDTVAYWHHWLAQSTYTGRWREMVHRSALALKLLTFAPTGAIVAAATTSLPEEIGGVRNWDYRFTWIRDAAFTVYGLMRVGFTDEAGAFMRWVEQRCHEPEPDGTLHIMYGVRGEHDLTERTLDHLEGYRKSPPVRVGNAAYDQVQLDIYGELMDSAYLFNKYGAPISYDFWQELRRMIDWVCDNWRRTDEGIWEVRGEPRHFVFSKLMCWVALDRGLRLADKRSFPADRERWLRVRDEIYTEILERGWSEKRQAFVQSYDSEELDAANLMMPLVFFMAPNDPRMLATLDAMLEPPERGGLTANDQVYRYLNKEGVDGLPGHEGTFNICTFWMVEALTRAGRTDRKRLEQARLIFERMLGYANHVGLYSEETGAHGEALGNFPQAFTHLALISAAYNLDRALGARD